MSLVKELDFKSEVVNAERTRKYFHGFEDMHIPHNIVPLSSRRTIVMEYIDGIRINDMEALQKEFGEG